MPSRFELMFFNLTVRNLLCRSVNVLAEDAKQQGFDKGAFEELMHRKKWCHAARLLIKFGEQQEKAVYSLGPDFWNPLAKVASMLKMADQILICEEYRIAPPSNSLPPPPVG